MASRGIAFRVSRGGQRANSSKIKKKKENKKRNECQSGAEGRTWQISNSEIRWENGEETRRHSFHSVFAGKATRTVHTRLAERKEWKWSVRVTYFCISARLSTASGGCDGLQRFSERGWLVRRGGPGLKAFRCKQPCYSRIRPPNSFERWRVIVSLFYSSTYIRLYRFAWYNWKRRGIYCHLYTGVQELNDRAFV